MGYNLLEKMFFIGGSDPLILTFDPNFQRDTPSEVQTSYILKSVKSGEPDVSRAWLVFLGSERDPV